MERLSTMPRPGNGRHKALLGIANLGVMAGFPEERIHSDLQEAVSSAPMPDKEISAAILKATREHQSGGTTYRPAPGPGQLVKDGQAALKRLIAQGTITEDADLCESSPIRLNDVPGSDPVILLKTLFDPADFIFIGGKYDEGNIGKNIRRAAEWIEFFRAGGKAGPFVVVNPFTGKPARKKSNDGESLRCDAAIASYRHCLVEFDNLGREDQIKFWSAAKLPIRALIDTGGKSIHAWLDVLKLFQVATEEQWNKYIKIHFYEKVLIPLGVDRACCNPSRLSRLPGWLRTETGRFQRILWLSQDGRGVV